MPFTPDPFMDDVLCVVIPGIDGPTLWDCECPECLDLQGAEIERQGTAPGSEGGIALNSPRRVEARRAMFEGFGWGVTR